MSHSSAFDAMGAARDATAGGFTAVCALTPWACAAAWGQSPAPVADPAARLALFGAAFAQSGPLSQPPGGTAMAFLPGRGVIAWDVAGKTPEQAKEAQVEAMGLADARAVQKEIDAAAAQRRAQLDSAPGPQPPGVAGAPRRLVLAPSPLAASAREAATAIALNAASRAGGGVLGVRNGEAVKGKGRMFAFAAASGRGVGLNMLHDEGSWKNGGLTTDRDGGYSGQRQAGLAWRKGLVQTSLSYVQQKDRQQILGVQSQKDHRVMLTATMSPQAILSLFAKPD